MFVHSSNWVITFEDSSGSFATIYRKWALAMSAGTSDSGDLLETLKFRVSAAFSRHFVVFKTAKRLKIIKWFPKGFLRQRNKK